MTPFLGEPTHPNPIGLSIVELRRVEECSLHLANLDVLDGTLLLDVKPYAPEFDRPRHVRTGWLGAARRQAGATRSDGRFA